MDLLPCLDDAAEKDGGTNIRTCKLVMRVTEVSWSCSIFTGMCPKTHVAQNHGDETHPTNGTDGSCLGHPLTKFRVSIA
jgi:hypothetical protein